MPNPDGTMTRDEHCRDIVVRANAYIALGMAPNDAIAKAGEEHRAAIRADGERKIAAVERWLRGDRRVRRSR